MAQILLITNVSFQTKSGAKEQPRPVWSNTHEHEHAAVAKLGQFVLFGAFIDYVDPGVDAIRLAKTLDFSAFSDVPSARSTLMGRRKSTARASTPGTTWRPCTCTNGSSKQ